MSSSLSALIEYSLKQPILSAAEERAAVEQKDYDLLIRAHLRLAVRIAFNYRGYGLPVEDLLSEAATGLMRAATRFNADNPTQARFGTYAQFWVRAAITEYVMHNSSLIKKGTTAASKKLFFAGSKIDNGSPEEVAERFHVRVEDVLEARRRYGRDFSLNTPVGVGDEQREWQDVLEDVDAPNPEEALADEQEAALERAQLDKAMSVLSSREREILHARFVEEPPVTLRDLAKRFGCSAERIRQLEVRALEKMRAAVGTVEQPSRRWTDEQRAKKFKECPECGDRKRLTAFAYKARSCLECEGDVQQAA